MTAVLLVGHGTVDDLADLPAFLTNIRRGHAPPPELLAEVRRRYEAIGGQSPLNAICRELATKIEARLGMPVRMANRLFAPYPKDVVAELGDDDIVVLPLAQHSASIYEQAVRRACPNVKVRAAGNWGPRVTKAFADSIVKTMANLPEDVVLLTTAHSLPVAIIEAGDPYEKEFRASALAVAEEVRRRRPYGEHVIAFQSQGMNDMKWLGPDLRSTLSDLRGKTVLVAPIGFLADHVEILYDLDIEAREWAKEFGIELYRSDSLNASEALVDVLYDLARDVIGGR